MGGCDDPAQPARDVQSCGYKQTCPTFGKCPGNIGGLRRVETGGDYESDDSAGGGRQPGDLLALRRVEGVGAGSVDQHGDTVLPAGQRARKRHGVAGDDERQPQQAREGGQLLGGAGASAIGGDDKGRCPSHDQASCQPRCRERFSRTRRPRQQ